MSSGDLRILFECSHQLLRPEIRQRVTRRDRSLSIGAQREVVQFLIMDEQMRQERERARWLCRRRSIAEQRTEYLGKGLTRGDGCTHHHVPIIASRLMSRSDVPGSCRTVVVDVRVQRVVSRQYPRARTDSALGRHQPC
jgi:hypothetical protein